MDSIRAFEVAERLSKDSWTCFSAGWIRLGAISGAEGDWRRKEEWRV